jgi:hypothetical protein
MHFIEAPTGAGIDDAGGSIAVSFRRQTKDGFSGPAGLRYCLDENGVPLGCVDVVPQYEPADTEGCFTTVVELAITEFQ